MPDSFVADAPRKRQDSFQPDVPDEAQDSFLPDPEPEVAKMADPARVGPTPEPQNAAPVGLGDPVGANDAMAGFAAPAPVAPAPAPAVAPVAPPQPIQPATGGLRRPGRTGEPDLDALADGAAFVRGSSGAVPIESLGMASTGPLGEEISPPAPLTPAEREALSRVRSGPAVDDDIKALSAAADRLAGPAQAGLYGRGVGRGVAAATAVPLAKAIGDTAFLERFDVAPFYKPRNAFERLVEQSAAMFAQLPAFEAGGVALGGVARLAGAGSRAARAAQLAAQEAGWAPEHIAQAAQAAARGAKLSRLAEVAGAGAVAESLGYVADKNTGVPIPKDDSVLGRAARGAITMGPLAFIPHAKTVLQAVGIKAPTDAAVLALSNALYGSLIEGKPFDPTQTAAEAGGNLLPFMLFNALGSMGRMPFRDYPKDAKEQANRIRTDAQRQAEEFNARIANLKERAKAGDKDAFEQLRIITGAVQFPEEQPVAQPEPSARGGLRRSEAAPKGQPPAVVEKAQPPSPATVEDTPADYYRWAFSQADPDFLASARTAAQDLFGTQDPDALPQDWDSAGRFMERLTASYKGPAAEASAPADSFVPESQLQPPPRATVVSPNAVPVSSPGLPPGAEVSTSTPSEQPSAAPEKPATPAAEQGQAGEAKPPELMTPEEWAASTLSPGMRALLAQGGSENQANREALLQDHYEAVLRAAKSKRPVSASAVEAYGRRGLSIPPGYVRDGDRYVFKPQPQQAGVEPDQASRPGAPKAGAEAAPIVPDAGVFNESAGPFTVEWGTRARGNKYETFDDLAEAKLFFNRKANSLSFDHASLTDANGNEWQEQSQAAPSPAGPRPTPTATPPGDGVQPPAQPGTAAPFATRGEASQPGVSTPTTRSEQLKAKVRRRAGKREETANAPETRSPSQGEPARAEAGTAPRPDAAQVRGQEGAPDRRGDRAGERAQAEAGTAAAGKAVGLTDEQRIAYDSILQKQGQAAADSYAEKVKPGWRPSANYGVEPPPATPPTKAQQLKAKVRGKAEADSRHQKQEPERPKRQYPRYKPSDRTPLLNLISDSGGIMGKSKMRHPSGDYDGAPAIWELGGFGRVVFGGEKFAPDQMAQMAHDQGIIREATPDALWNALRKEITDYRKQRGESTPTEEESYYADQAEAWKRLVAKRSASGKLLTEGQFVLRSDVGESLDDVWIVDEVALPRGQEVLKGTLCYMVKGEVTGTVERVSEEHLEPVEETSDERGKRQGEEVAGRTPGNDEARSGDRGGASVERGEPDATESAREGAAGQDLILEQQTPEDVEAERAASEAAQEQERRDAETQARADAKTKRRQTAISTQGDLLDQGFADNPLFAAPAPKTSLLSDTAAVNSPATEAEEENIQDFGEKIGGARKDTADRGYTRRSKPEKPDDGVPPWRKKYVALEKVDGSGWTVGKAGAYAFGIEPMGGQLFTTQAEAEKAIPLYAVADAHRVYQDKDGKWEIFRRVGARKLLRVVNRSFESREDAMKHMALHAEELLNLKTSFGEEILPVPDIATRTGVPRRATDATAQMFMDTFAPRGIEFGNWQNQEERQMVMNHAYDGLLDLADALGLPPKALMLNGELAVAFGARGQGLSGAKAHYERDYGVINLTKMKGAGSLAHEWMHALDHYLARMDTKAPAERKPNERGDLAYPDTGVKLGMQSHGYSYRSRMREELKQAYDNLVRSLYKRAENYVEDTTIADKFLGRAKEYLRERLNQTREMLSEDRRRYHKHFGAPASVEQLAAFDKLADLLVEGGDLETKWVQNENARARVSFNGHQTNATLDAISAIVKAVRNRSGFRENEGPLDKVAAAMRGYRERIRMLEEAKKGVGKEHLTTTAYAVEAKKMDQARSGDYWSEPHEMTARAFAAYVEDKIAENGGQSDFLVYHAHGGILLPMIDGFVARPYPEGDERKAINAMFAKFIGEIKTRETDKGVAMYGSIRTGDHNEEQLISAVVGNARGAQIPPASKSRWDGAVESARREVADSPEHSRRLAGVRTSARFGATPAFRSIHAIADRLGIDAVPVDGGDIGGGFAQQDRIFVKDGPSAIPFAVHEIGHILDNRGDPDVRALIGMVDKRSALFKHWFNVLAGTPQAFAEHRYNAIVRLGITPEEANDPKNDPLLLNAVEDEVSRELTMAVLSGRDDLTAVYRNASEARMTVAKIIGMIVRRMGVLMPMRVQARGEGTEGGIQHERERTEGEARNIKAATSRRNLAEWNVFHRVGRLQWRREFERFVSEDEGGNRRNSTFEWRNTTYSDAFENSPTFQRVFEHFERQGAIAIPVEGLPYFGAVSPDGKLVFIRREADPVRLDIAIQHESFHVQARRNNPKAKALINRIDRTRHDFRTISDSFGRGDDYAAEEITAAAVAGDDAMRDMFPDDADTRRLFDEAQSVTMPPASAFDENGNVVYSVSPTLPLRTPLSREAFESELDEAARVVPFAAEGVTAGLSTDPDADTAFWRMLEDAGQGQAARRETIYGQPVVDFSKSDEWRDVFYGTPTPDRIQELSRWLRENPNSYIRLYHGTAAVNPIREQGVLKTGRGRRNSLQSGSGFTYWSVYPGMAQQFGSFAAANKPRDAAGNRVAVYSAPFRVAELLADVDQLRNQRLFAGRTVGNSLAESLAVGHGARIKSDVIPSRIDPKELRFYRSRNGQVRAITYGKRSHFFLDRYDNASQLRGDILEEAGHRLVNELGAREFSGPMGIGQRTYRGEWGLIRSEIERNYGYAPGTPEFAHEFVAKAFRDGKHRVGLWRRFLDALVMAFKRLMWRLSGGKWGQAVSDAEVRNYLNRMMTAKARGRNPGADMRQAKREARDAGSSEDPVTRLRTRITGKPIGPDAAYRISEDARRAAESLVAGAVEGGVRADIEGLSEPGAGVPVGPRPALARYKSERDFAARGRLVPVGRGTEANAYRPVGGQVVFKVFAPRPEGVGTELRPVVDAEGKVRFNRAGGSREALLRRITVGNEIGLTPTEIVATTEDGGLIVKQPLAPATTRDAGDQQRISAAVEVPSSRKGYPSKNPLWLVYASGTHYFVADIRDVNLGADSSGRARLFDYAIAEADSEVIAAAGLEDIARQAEASARILEEERPRAQESFSRASEMLKPSDAMGGTAQAAKVFRNPVVTPEQDREYMAAVERGDTETAQRMVDEAAKRAQSLKLKQSWSNAYEMGKRANENGVKSERVFFESMSLEELESLPLESPGWNAFFRAGFYGDDAPEYVTGWRYGKIPESDQSTNFREQRNERGVSLMRLDGEEASSGAKVYEMFNRKGNMLHVGGWYAGRGTDGEPLIVGAKEIKSADPITRDDKGRVIPLSERFNAETPDSGIARGEAPAPRESRPLNTVGAVLKAAKAGEALTDAEGKTLTVEQAVARIKGGDVVKAGEPNAGLAERGQKRYSMESEGRHEWFTEDRLSAPASEDWQQTLLDPGLRRRQGRLDDLARGPGVHQPADRWPLDRRALGSKAIESANRIAGRHGYEVIPTSASIRPFTDPDARVVVVSTAAGADVAGALSHELTHVLHNAGNPDVLSLEAEVDHESEAVKSFLGRLASEAPAILQGMVTEARDKAGVSGKRVLSVSEQARVIAELQKIIAEEMAAMRVQGDRMAQGAFKNDDRAAGLVESIIGGGQQGGKTDEDSGIRLDRKGDTGAGAKAAGRGVQGRSTAAGNDVGKHNLQHGVRGRRQRQFDAARAEAAGETVALHTGVWKETDVSSRAVSVDLGSIENGDYNDTEAARYVASAGRGHALPPAAETRWNDALERARQRTDPGSENARRVGSAKASARFGESDTFRGIDRICSGLGIQATPIEHFGFGGGFAMGNEIFVAEGPQAGAFALHEITHILESRKDHNVLALIDDVNQESPEFRRQQSYLLTSDADIDARTENAIIRLKLTRRQAESGAHDARIKREIDRGISEEVVAAVVSGRDDLIGAFRDPDKARVRVAAVANRVFSGVRASATNGSPDIRYGQTSPAEPSPALKKALRKAPAEVLRATAQAGASEATRRHVATLIERLNARRVAAGLEPLPPEKAPRTPVGVLQAMVRMGAKDSGAAEKVRSLLSVALEESQDAKAAAAVSEGRMSLRAAVNRLRSDSAKQTAVSLLGVKKEIVRIAKERLPVAERGRLLLRVAQARTADDLADTVVLIDRIAEQSQKKLLISAIKDMTSKAIHSGAVAVDYKQRIRDVLDGLLTSKPLPQTLERMRSLQDFIARETAAGRDVEIPGRLLAKLHVLTDRALADMDVAELEDIAAEIATLVKLGKVKLNSIQAIDQARKERDLADLTAQGLNPITSADLERPAIGEPPRMGARFRNAARLSAEGLNTFYLWHVPTDVLFDIIDGNRHYRGAAWRIFKGRVNTSFGGYRGAFWPLEQEFSEVIGRHHIGKAESIRVGAYAVAQQQTPSDANYGRKKLYNTFGADTPEKQAALDAEIDAIRLTPDEQAYYDWMRAKMDAIRPELARTAKDVYNAELDEVANYFPMQTDWDLMENDVLDGWTLDETGNMVKKNPEKGMLHARTGAGKQKVRIDSARAFMKHMSDALYLVHMAPTTKYLGELARTPEFKELAGDQGQRLVLEFVDTMARKGGVGGEHIIRWLDVLRRNVGVGTLGFRLSSILIQPSSFIDSLGLLGPWGFKGATNIMQREWRQFVMTNLQEVRDRVGDDPSFLEWGGSRLSQRIVTAGYWPLEQLDRITAAAVGAGAYDRAMHRAKMPVFLTDADRAAGLADMTPAEQRRWTDAHKTAVSEAELMVRRTQASGAFKDVPLAVSRGKLLKSRTLAKMLYQFQTFTMNKFSLLAHDAIGNAVKNKEWLQAAFIIMLGALAYATEEQVRMALGRLLGKKERDDDSVGKEVAWDFVNSVPVFGQLAQSVRYGSVPVPVVKTAADVVKGARSLATAKSPEAQKRGLVGLIGAAGSLVGVPGISQAADITKRQIKAPGERLREKLDSTLAEDAYAGWHMDRVNRLGSRLYREARAEGMLATHANGKAETEREFRERVRAAYRKRYGEIKADPAQ